MCMSFLYCPLDSGPKSARGNPRFGLIPLGTRSWEPAEGTWSLASRGSPPLKGEGEPGLYGIATEGRCGRVCVFSPWLKSGETYSPGCTAHRH